MWFGPKMGISALKGVQKNFTFAKQTVYISIKGEMIDKLTLTYNWDNLGSCSIGLVWELFIKSMS